MAMKLWRSMPHVLADRELIQLRNRLGGSVGELTIGGEKTQAVQVRENVFVTTLKGGLSKAAQAILGMAGADLHKPKGEADILLLKQRLRGYDNG